MFDHQLGEEMPPDVQSKSPWSNFNLFPHAISQEEEPNISLFASPLQDASRSNEIAPHPLFFQPRQAQSPKPLTTDICSSPFISSATLLLIPAKVAKGKINSEKFRAVFCLLSVPFKPDLCKYRITLVWVKIKNSEKL